MQLEFFEPFFMIFLFEPENEKLNNCFLDICISVIY